MKTLEYNPIKYYNSGIRVSKKMLKFISVVPAIFTVSAFAAQNHIADDVQLFMHSGPSYEFRIVGRVRSGDSITIDKASGDYTKIKTESGKEGWVLTRYIAEGESQLKSLQSELPTLRSEVDNLRAELTHREEQLQTVQTQLTNFRAETSNRDAEVLERDKRIRELEFQVASMDQSNLMRWLTHGGLIALGGLIIGVIVSNLPRRKKRQSEWF
ncbi:TIGR04211 family SH3 domain-containing protein [Marinobacterium sp. LSUCC0821]|uniref:TIGR04211 family SH3 domain-containing protein n=1 Tax=Marinobacterium sp. LSUCC0821 TaxID=2668067 RepID=UPI0014526AE6|nr:TIGR04211 family SH3 domain-containing protein [Marinobacterium sp. LSUCC0821]QJD70645.1 TIGR04211 family SH3 domain-containing protein [Marinobacterium sp. LSUCC0821]